MDDTEAADLVYRRLVTLRTRADRRLARHRWWHSHHSVWTLIRRGWL